MVLVYSIVAGLFSTFLHKDQSTTPKRSSVQDSRQAIYAIIQDPEMNQTAGGKLAIAVFRQTMCSTIGEACTDNPEDATKNFDNSLMGFVGNLIVTPYKYPPSSGLYWAYSGLENVGFVPNARAAGIGFYSLQAFQPFWSAFRTISYIAIVLIVVTIGFFIMFRVQVSAQTIVTVENALPRIVLTLLFITFSFAIAGFIIDLAYLFIFLIFEVFALTGMAGMNVPDLQNQYLQGFNGVGGLQNAFGHGFNIYLNGLQGLYASLPLGIQQAIHAVMLLLEAIFVIQIMNATSGTLTKLGGNAAVGLSLIGSITVDIIALITAIVGLGFGIALAPLLLYLLFVLVAVFGLMYLFFRIFFLLIGAYIQIIIQVILAPLLILPHAIPGNDSFWSWLKKVFGYTMVFPLVIFFLVFIEAIYQLTSSVNLPGANAVPQPFGLPLLDNFNTTTFVAIISASIMFMIPDLVKSAIKPIVGESAIPAGPGTLFAGASAGIGQLYGGYARLASLAPHLSGKGPAGWIRSLAGKAGIEVPGKPKLPEPDSAALAHPDTNS